MSRFELTALTSGPAELGAALPITGDTVAILTGPDGAAIYHAVLDRPIRDRSADLDTVPAAEHGQDDQGRFRWVREIFLAPSLEGSAPHFEMADFPVAIAYLPPGAGTSGAEVGALDFRAEGLISDVEDAVTRRRRAIPPLADELADDPAMTPPDTPSDDGGGASGADEAGALDFRAEGLISDVEDAVTRRRRAIPPLADELADDPAMTPPDTPSDDGVAEPNPHPRAPRADPPVDTEDIPPPLPVMVADVPPPRLSGGVDNDPGPVVAPPPPVRPSRPSGPASGRIADVAPPTTTATVPAARRRAYGVWAAAALAAGAVLGLIGWSVTRDRTGPADTAAPVPPVTSTPAATPVPPTPRLVPAVATDATLQALLPAGFPTGACTAEAEVAPGVLGALNCGPNTDPGGPTSARYTLTADLAELETQFQDVLTATRQQDCPGRIQSPGPWRKNATPGQVAGTLYCGTRSDGTVVLAWTDTARSVLAVLDAPPGAQSATYGWWTNHS